ncbi:MAG: histidine--tRNA ligase [Cytophagales bacterium]|nr:MAG: histidine--tRNA ligase [Cytophagales bacterium]
MKPSLPKGTRDFSPSQLQKRDYIFEIIKNIFKKFAFAPIETPTIENLSVLTGKYGDEGDQLIFKILNSGDYLLEAKNKNIDLQNIDIKKLLPLISEKALRYDLTVPFARYVVMNRNDITFPFKRFQIQPVWRADRPQKGRYREFYQCDADVIGTDSLICEAEIVLMIQEVLVTLGLKNFEIKINNRKILSGITEIIGAFGKEADICTAIDKIDKIGIDGVKKELIEREILEQAIEKLIPIINFKGNNIEIINFLYEKLNLSEIGKKGIEEIKKVLAYISNFEVQIPELKIDISLARGLSYYTGAIFEVKVLDAQMGSITGGGRYDNLTGLFGLEGVSGVGISFGVERIYDVMEELKLFPEFEKSNSKVLITYFDEPTMTYGIKILSDLRNKNIASEIYPQVSKIKKQFEYANAKNIPYVIVLGENELQNQTVTLKNMISGEQNSILKEEIYTYIK